MGNARLNHDSDDRRRPSRRSGPRLVRAVAAATPTRAAWGLGGLGLVLLAAALANGLVVAQTSGCARCGASPPSPIVAEPPSLFRSSGVDRAPGNAETRISERKAEEERRRRRGLHGLRPRLRRRAFFPSRISVRAAAPTARRSVCQAQCPNAKVELYSFPLGGTIDEAVSSTGEPYAICRTRTSSSKPTIRAARAVAPGRAGPKRSPPPRRNTATRRTTSWSRRRNPPRCPGRSRSPRKLSPRPLR